MRVADDARLVELARSGSSAAFDELFRRHHRAVHAVAYHLLADGDAADDVVQEVFIRVHRSLPSFRGDCAVKAWVMRIAVNSCISHQRKAKYRRAEPIEAGDRPVPDDRPTLAQDAAAEALAGLKPVERALVVLRDVQGHTYEEIAQILCCSPNSVGVRLHRARTKLRSQFARIRQEQAEP